MTREEQIENLIRAWEALGDGYHVIRTGWAAGFYNGEYTDDRRNRVVVLHNDYSTGAYRIPRLFQDGTDAMDATPCLLLLRSVYGEEWDINHYLDLGRQESHWIVCDLLLEKDLTCSTVSRIHAVTLALEEKP